MFGEAKMSVPPELLSGAAGVAAGAGAGLLTGNPLFGLMAGISVAGGAQQMGIQSSEAQADLERARYATLAGREEAERVRRAGLKLVGQQIANYGASGIVGGQGSPATVMEDTMSNIELKAQDALQNAYMTAAGLKYQSGIKKQEAMNTVFTTGANVLSEGVLLGAFDNFKMPTFGQPKYEPPKLKSDNFGGLNATWLLR